MKHHSRGPLGREIEPRLVPCWLRVQGVGFGVQGSGFRVQGSEFRVHD